MEQALKRRSWRAGILAALLLAPLAAAHARPIGVGDVTPSEIASARPGQILRIWPQAGGSVKEGKAYHILYRSTGLHGEATAVSGAVFVPVAPGRRGRRDIVAWAHPTTGVLDRCAPTRLPDLSGTIPGLAEMLDRGYVVAATDYAGLGTPGMHPYLIGESEAMAVLDSVRAARELPDAHAGNRFAVWGHSQGGHAALFTGQLAAQYAPELKLVGVAAAAPATDLAELFAADHNTKVGRSLTAMALFSWSSIFDIPLATILAPGARASFEAVAHDCIQSLSGELKLEQDTKGLSADFLKGDPTKREPWRSIMTRNSPGQSPAGAPVFIAQGSADAVVRLAITERFADHLCLNGAKVRMVVLNGVTHSRAGEVSAHRAVAWIANRFAGRDAPSNCRR